MIEFRNISKVYNNGTEALHNINLKVEKGEFVFIVGSSGAGKSTFLKLITCEEKPNEGQIIVDGIEITALPKRKIPYFRRKMGMVFQDFRLIDHMTVYDNVAFAMRVVGASGRVIKKRVPYILSLVGLQHKAKQHPNELSGGERQRVGLARALVNNPSIIIADEPTGNIDPALSFEIVDLLSEINRRGTTILMVTHEHSLVKHFHKRIIQIHSGEIVADTAAAAIEAQERAQKKAKEEAEVVNEEELILTSNEEIAEDITEEEISEEFDIENYEPESEEFEESDLPEALDESIIEGDFEDLDSGDDTFEELAGDLADDSEVLADIEEFESEEYEESPIDFLKDDDDSEFDIDLDDLSLDDIEIDEDYEIGSDAEDEE